MGLHWRFKSPRKNLIFMDMTIQVKWEKIITTIYAKPMALYQYIPPNSCHPPGVLTGLIFGQILWIYQQCSQSKDINKELSIIHMRLQNRGYASKNYFPSLRRVLTMPYSTCPKLKSKGMQLRRLRLVNWTKESSSISPTTPKTLHLDSFKTFGET